MYASKKSIEHLPKSTLVRNFYSFLSVTNKIYCPKLGRPVFFDKQPDAILNRKDAKHRLQCFLSSMDILKHSKKWTEKILNNQKNIEIEGLSKDLSHVFIHLREENIKGDKKLFFISCFHS